MVLLLYFTMIYLKESGIANNVGYAINIAIFIVILN